MSRTYGSTRASTVMPEVRERRGGLARREAAGQLQEGVLHEQGGQAQKRVLLQRDHAVHVGLEALGVGGHAQLLLHLRGNPLHGLVLVAGHVGHERKPEEVLGGGNKGSGQGGDA